MADWVSIINQQYEADVKNGIYPDNWEFKPTPEAINAMFVNTFGKTIDQINNDWTTGTDNFVPSQNTMYRSTVQGMTMGAADEQKAMHPLEWAASQEKAMNALGAQQAAPSDTFAIGGTGGGNFTPSTQAQAALAAAQAAGNVPVVQPNTQPAQPQQPAGGANFVIGGSAPAKPAQGGANFSIGPGPAPGTATTQPVQGGTMQAMGAPGSAGSGTMTTMPVQQPNGGYSNIVGTGNQLLAGINLNQVLQSFAPTKSAPDGVYGQTFSQTPQYGMYQGQAGYNSLANGIAPSYFTAPAANVGGTSGTNTGGSAGGTQTGGTGNTTDGGGGGPGSGTGNGDGSSAGPGTSAGDTGAPSGIGNGVASSVGNAIGTAIGAAIGVPGLGQVGAAIGNSVANSSQADAANAPNAAANSPTAGIAVAAEDAAAAAAASSGVAPVGPAAQAAIEAMIAEAQAAANGDTASSTNGAANAAAAANDAAANIGIDAAADAVGGVGSGDSAAAGIGGPGADGIGDGSGGTAGSGDGSSDGSGDSAGGAWAKGGIVSKKKLVGPNPKGPDDGYGKLQGGEFVIPKRIVDALGPKYFYDLIKQKK